MKKLFTLALALMVVVGGFSQARSVSKKDMRAAQTYQAARTEGTLTNVQSHPNMTRTDGELDYSYYDWQSNDGARTWTIAWPDGKMSFAYTIATDENYSDRGTGIGTYDPEADEWIHCDARVEPEKTGFGSIARYDNNSIIVAAHTATECGVYFIEDKDNITPGCATLQSHLENSNEPTWPAIMTSGTNRNIVHVVALGYSDNMIYYYRSQDRGETWDKENVVLPFLTTEYGSDYNSNCYHWMETTDDNCLALVINNAWCDGMVIYSYDNGETWERKVYYHHPGINTTYDTWFMYPRYVSAQWASNGELRMAYEFNGTTGEPGSGSYYPGIGGVAFWSETLPYYGEATPTYGTDPTNPMPPTPGQPFIMDSSYIYEDIYASWWLWSDASHDMWPEYMGYLSPLDEEGNPLADPYSATTWNIDDRSLHGSYNGGVCAFPVLCMIPGSDDMVAVWSAMDELNTDGTNFYYKLFASASNDNGRTWSDMVQLTTDFMYQYNECVYPQALVRNNTLIIAVQMDPETGTFVMGDDPDGSNNYYQGLTFDLAELWPDYPLGIEEQEVDNSTRMSVYPNPAVDQLNVTLNQSSDIVIYNIMGQNVMSVKGHAGANSINISSLNAGIYFVSAGNEMQKFVVK